MIRIDLHRARWTDGLGLLCLIATLLLLSAGVRIARAGDLSQLEGAACEVPEATSPAPAPDRRARVRVPQQREPISDVVVLNTRGYNYGPGREGQAPPIATPSTEAVSPPAASPATPKP